MNKSEVIKTGYYNYKLPHWDDFIPVFVSKEKGTGKLLVRFSEGRYPTELKDIPEMAEFVLLYEE